MPRKLSRTTRLTGLTAALAGAALALPGAAAAATCPDTPASHPFASWGDSALYSLAPGGSFESLSWTPTGSPALVQENNPFNLSGLGATSVRLRGADTITSPSICVSAAHPYLRFVANARDTDSRLVIEVLWSDAGVDKTKVLEEHPADHWRAWKPSKVVPLGSALPTGDGQVHEVRLRLSLKDRVGEWLVDDIYVDPLKRG